jgi:hypothetical protein
VSIKDFFRIAPGLSIIGIFMAVFWSPFFVMLPPDFQLFMVKLFLPTAGVVLAHWIGKVLFPKVENWNNSDQPFVKIVRIVLYAALPIAIALGG